MASDPSYALQTAVYAAIKNVAGGQVYDRVPATSKPPYVQFGNDTITTDNDSADLSDCTVVINVVAPDKTAAKNIAGEVRTALDKLLPVNGYVTLEGWLEESRNQSGDGKFELVVMDFHYLLLPNG
jgi:hypothetical protein